MVDSDGSHEELVAVALVIEENLTLTCDFVLSSLIPSKVVLGVFKILLETLTVGESLLQDFLVELLDLSELGDGGSTNKLVGLVLGVSGSLGISVGLLEVLKKAKD